MSIADATIDGILDAHRGALGRDYVGYRHHVYRVAHLCAALAPDGTAQWPTIALAAAFHDLGIWTAGTFDYLAPSIDVMTRWMAERGLHAWTATVARMIDDHHKLAPSRGEPLVESFRRADWIDVLWGLPTFGLSRSLIRALRREWPDAGFHATLGRLALGHALRHPCAPLPMIKR